MDEEEFLKVVRVPPRETSTRDSGFLRLPGSVLIMFPVMETGQRSPSADFTSPHSVSPTYASHLVD